MEFLYRIFKKKARPSSGLDVFFSLDSVITAIGLAEHIHVMVLAIMIAAAIMMLSAKFIGDFVDDHPTIKMPAWSFLVLVGAI